MIQREFSLRALSQLRIVGRVGKRANKTNVLPKNREITNVHSIIQERFSGAEEIQGLRQLGVRSPGGRQQFEILILLLKIKCGLSRQVGQAALSGSIELLQGLLLEKMIYVFDIDVAQ